MDSTSQVELPESFLAIYLRPGQTKPKVGWEEVYARYELCEDLACMLQETAKTMQNDLFLSEQVVLERCHAGLRGPDAVLRPKEAAWVVRRLAELIEWDSSTVLQLLDQWEIAAE